MKKKFLDTLSPKSKQPTKEVQTEPLRSEINYVIDESGNVTDIAVKGNNENFNNEIKAAFLRANDGVKWKPSTKNGAVISYTMRLSMTMSFQ
ncbi:hypothetical protein ACM39_00900 [Chryseobacterium sp. FH2]|nr:hypothetical protein ACM39_00900 [Chryseobacterium sp. FH2]